MKPFLLATRKTPSPDSPVLMAGVDGNNLLAGQTLDVGKDSPVLMAGVDGNALRRHIALVITRIRPFGWRAWIETATGHPRERAGGWIRPFGWRAWIETADP